MKYFLLIAGCLVLTSCSTVAPSLSEKDCKHKVYVLEEGLNASYELSASLLRSDVIDWETAESVADKLDVADITLNKAAPLCVVDERTALNLLLEVKSSLDEVDAILGEE